MEGTIQLSVALAYDCTSANLAATIAIVGNGVQFFGYDTGSGGGVKWTPAQFSEHPSAVHYDQDPDDSDFTSDLLDVEALAGTIARAGNWYKNTLRSFDLGLRVGQREPGFYASASNITALVNGLIAQGVKSGPGLLVANWNLTEPAAVAELEAASGPFPIIGLQFKNDGPFDTNVVSSTWLVKVSKKPVAASTVRGVVVASDLTTVAVTSTDRKTWAS
jgi:hypothetical protein